ncbi:MAG: ThuA domain-containing protein [Planctomycetota bacterium]|nr:ThuA domain-containing protein [Planctomycetota bacterium]
MRTLSLSSVTLSLLAFSCASHGPNEEVLSPGKELDAQPIRALLVTGGCCHDYDNQKTIITEGISARARVEWTIVHEGGSRSENVRDHKLGVFENQEWADEYDVVVHNTCFGGLRDEDFVGAFVNAHREKGVGAVVLHCGLHSYRNLEGKTWHNFLGIASKRHEKGAPVPVENARPDHPIMATFPESWTTAKDELYVVHETWPGVVPLGLAWGTETKIHHPVIWVNRSGQARVFGTSLGHSNETMGNPIYLDLIARGLLWAVGKLDEGGNPLEGYEAAPAPAPAEE